MMGRWHATYRGYHVLCLPGLLRSRSVPREGRITLTPATTMANSHEEGFSNRCFKGVVCERSKGEGVDDDRPKCHQKMSLKLNTSKAELDGVD